MAKYEQKYQKLTLFRKEFRENSSKERLIAHLQLAQKHQYIYSEVQALSLI